MNNLLRCFVVVLPIALAQPFNYQATDAQIQDLQTNTGGMPSTCLCENSVLSCTVPAMSDFNMTTTSGVEYYVTAPVYVTAESGIYTQSKEGTMFDNPCTNNDNAKGYKNTPCDKSTHKNSTYSVFMQKNNDQSDLKCQNSYFNQETFKVWCQTITFDMDYKYGVVYNAFEQSSKVYQNGTLMPDGDYTVAPSCEMLSLSRGWLMMNNQTYAGVSLPFASQAINWFAKNNDYYDKVQSYLETFKQQGSPQLDEDMASIFYGGQELPGPCSTASHCYTYQVVGNQPVSTSVLPPCTMNIQIKTGSQTCFQIADCDNARGSYTFSNATQSDELISLRYQGKQCQSKTCMLTGFETWSQSEAEKCDIWFSEGTQCNFVASPSSTDGLSKTVNPSCLFNPASQVTTSVASNEVTDSGPSVQPLSWFDEIWDWFLRIIIIAVMICVVIVVIASLPGCICRGLDSKKNTIKIETDTSLRKSQDSDAVSEIQMQQIGISASNMNFDHPIVVDQHSQSPLLALIIVTVYSSVMTVFYIRDEMGGYVSMTVTMIMFMLWICMFVTIVLFVVKSNHISVTSSLGLALGTYSSFIGGDIGEWISIGFALIYFGKLYKCDTTSETTFIMAVMASQTYTYTKLMQSWQCSGKGANAVGSVISVWMLIIVAYFTLKPKRNLLAVAGFSAIILYFTRVEEEVFAACQNEDVKSTFLAVIQVSSVISFLLSLVVWVVKDRYYPLSQKKTVENPEVKHDNEEEEFGVQESQLLVGNTDKKPDTEDDSDDGDLYVVGKH